MNKIKLSLPMCLIMVCFFSCKSEQKLKLVEEVHVECGTTANFRCLNPETPADIHTYRIAENATLKILDKKIEIPFKKDVFKYWYEFLYKEGYEKLNINDIFSGKQKIPLQFNKNVSKEDQARLVDFLSKKMLFTRIGIAMNEGNYLFLLESEDFYLKEILPLMLEQKNYLPSFLSELIWFDQKGQKNLIPLNLNDVDFVPDYFRSEPTIQDIFYSHLLSKIILIVFHGSVTIKRYLPDALSDNRTYVIIADIKGGKPFSLLKYQVIGKTFFYPTSFQLSEEGRFFYFRKYDFKQRKFIDCEIDLLPLKDELDEFFKKNR